LGADERVSAAEALRAYTFGSAFASFTEADRGTIEVGKLADFAVLSHDPTDPETLDEVRVLATVVGGDMVFERSGDAGT